MASNTMFYSLTPQQLLALTGYGEAAIDGVDGMLGVMNVVKNRTKNSAFADSGIMSSTEGSVYHGVILKPYQFSIYNQSDPNRPKIESIARNFNATLNTNSTLRTAYSLAGQVLSGSIHDNTYGATYYHALGVRPSWASQIPVVGQIGTQIFYGASQIWETVSQNPIQWGLVGAAAIIALFIFVMKRRK